MLKTCTKVDIALHWSVFSFWVHTTTYLLEQRAVILCLLVCFGWEMTSKCMFIGMFQLGDDK